MDKVNKPPKTKEKTFWVILAISIFVIFEFTTYVSTGKFLICGRYGNCGELNIQKERLANIVTYECSGEGLIQAQFYTDNTVNLKVYKSNTPLLKERLSADGSRYINTDKSVVFWSEGDENMSTFLEKDGVVILSCKFQSSGE